MLYLTRHDLDSLGCNWGEIINVVELATRSICANDYAQPIKVYLRYNDPVNRIIAMPAFVGGDIQRSGLKWIASFPGNIKKGQARAHSVTILNDAQTGVPLCIINSSRISAIRTAGVTGLILRQLLEKFPRRLKVGIIGFGPIGQIHLDMLSSFFHESIDTLAICDLGGIDPSSVDPRLRDRVLIKKGWEELYAVSDVIITCTAGSDRYIDQPPAKGSWHLDVSLRDYKPEVLREMTVVIVDDWNEVCREQTDIHVMNTIHGLQENQVITIANVIGNDALKSMTEKDTLLFCPMGMAAYDVTVAHYYYEKGIATQTGRILND